MPVVLRRDTPIPLHRQIETSIRDAIRAGRLPRGSPLPPSRVLAADLGVSRGVVVEAYQQLASEGYLASYAGGYTQVAAGPAPTVAGLRLARETPPRIDLSYGRADVSSFPRAAWLRAIRGALASAPNDLFGYLAGSGVPELRTAIAGYLNRVRGTVAQPDQIVISTGYAQGIALLVGVLAARGATRLALEDPSSGDDALPAARTAGLEVTGIPVDRNGIRVDLLAASGADAVVLTPSHQWPTGSVLSAERRAAVLRWAAGSGAVVIEDDYDAEYRYDRAAVGALQGLDADRVVYLGSASKTLAPALRLGWIVLPAALVGPVSAEKVLADRGTNRIDQHAFAGFLERGELDRHLRRMRIQYRARRDALVAALGEALPEGTVQGVAAGLHVTVRLPDGLDEAAVRAEAQRRGIALSTLGANRIGTGPLAPTLLLGYARLPEAAIAPGVRELAAAVRRVAETP